MVCIPMVCIPMVCIPMVFREKFFDGNLWRKILPENFAGNFFAGNFQMEILSGIFFFNYNLLTIASFRIGVPSILFFLKYYKFSKVFSCTQLDYKKIISFDIFINFQIFIAVHINMVIFMMSTNIELAILGVSCQ